LRQPSGWENLQDDTTAGNIWREGGALAKSEIVRRYKAGKYRPASRDEVKAAVDYGLTMKWILNDE
jgi:hypothetical protein